MYKKLIRPILFLFKPEFIHDFSFYSIKIIFKIPLIKYLFKKLFVLENKYLEYGKAAKENSQNFLWEKIIESYRRIL